MRIPGAPAHGVPTASRRAQNASHRWLVALLAPLLAGCALAARAAIGPTVDRRSGLGFEVAVTGRFGVATGPGGPVVSGSGGGGLVDRRTPFVSGGAEAAMLVKADSGPDARIGLLYSGRHL